MHESIVQLVRDVADSADKSIWDDFCSLAFSPNSPTLTTQSPSWLLKEEPGQLFVDVPLIYETFFGKVIISRTNIVQGQRTAGDDQLCAESKLAENLNSIENRV